MDKEEFWLISCLLYFREPSRETKLFCWLTFVTISFRLGWTREYMFKRMETASEIPILMKKKPSIEAT